MYTIKPVHNYIVKHSYSLLAMKKKTRPYLVRTVTRTFQVRMPEASSMAETHVVTTDHILANMSCTLQIDVMPQGCQDEITLSLNIV